MVPLIAPLSWQAFLCFLVLGRGRMFGSFFITFLCFDTSREQCSWGHVFFVFVSQSPLQCLTIYVGCTRNVVHERCTGSCVMGCVTPPRTRRFASADAVFCCVVALAVCRFVRSEDKLRCCGGIKTSPGTLQVSQPREELQPL